MIKSWTRGKKKKKNPKGGKKVRKDKMINQ